MYLMCTKVVGMEAALQPVETQALTLVDTPRLQLRPVTESAAAVLDNWSQSLSPNTWRAYNSDLRGFAKATSEYHDGTAVGAADWFTKLAAPQGHDIAAQWAAMLATEGLSSATISRKLTALCSLSQVAAETGFATWQLNAKRFRPKVTAYRDTTGPAPQVVDALLAEARRPREYALLQLLAGRALRREEICSLNVEHLRLASSELLVLRKGKTERESISLTVDVVEALQAHLDAIDRTSGPLFVSTRGRSIGERLSGQGVANVLERICKRAGMPYIHPHAFRHFACTQAIAAGIALPEVQAFMGHSDISTTMRYVDRALKIDLPAGDAVQALLRGIRGS